MRRLERGKSFGRCDSCQEAARKGCRQGPEGPEAGRKSACYFTDSMADVGGLKVAGSSGSGMDNAFEPGVS